MTTPVRSGSPSETPRESARPRWGTQLVGPAVSGALLVLVLFLPDLGPPVTDPPPIVAYHARIVELLEPHRPDPARPGGGFLPDARVLILEGPQASEEVDAYLQGPGGQQDASGYRVGEDVVATLTATPDGGSPFAAVQDRWRLPQLLALIAAFALSVIAVGGWRGVRALLALALTAAIVVRVLVPLVLQGIPPIPVAVALSTAITIVTIGLTEGLSRIAVAAILGTAGALAFTAVLAGLVIAAAGFSNAVGQELIYLETATGLGLDLRGLLLAAFMLGTIGVLDDLTVTQAAAVDELVRHSALRGRRLFMSAMAIGRAHIAAIVNTLFLAYLGASLPLVVLLAASRMPTNLVINSEPIAIEVVRTLVGSLGIVVGLPFTTAISVWLIAAAPGSNRLRQEDLATAPPKRWTRTALSTVLVGGLALIGLATAFAALLIGPWIASPPRQAVVPDRFGATARPSLPPSTAPPGTPDAGPTSTFGPGSTPRFGRIGDPLTVVEAGATLGTVTILQVRTAAGGAGPPLDVEIRYQAQRPLRVDPAAWVATAPSGGGGVGRSSSLNPSLEAGTLQPGESVTGWLAFDVSTRPPETSLVFFGQDGTPQLVVPLS